jgi:hypothetical protein
MKCPSTQKYHEPSFLWEVWTWHTLATLVFCARWSVRLRTVGWRGLRGDDYFSVLAITCCSCNLAAMTVGYKFGSVLDFSDEEFAEKTACQLDRIRIGTKFQVCGRPTQRQDFHLRVDALLTRLSRRSFWPGIPTRHSSGR